MLQKLRMQITFAWVLAFGFLLFPFVVAMYDAMYMTAVICPESESVPQLPACIAIVKIGHYLSPEAKSLTLVHLGTANYYT